MSRSGQDSRVDLDDPLGPAAPPVKTRARGAPAVADPPRAAIDDEPNPWANLDPAKLPRPTAPPPRRSEPAASASRPTARAAVPVRRGEALTLTEACEPVFGLICRLNRAARKGRSPGAMDTVRQQIYQAIDEAHMAYVQSHLDAGGDAGRKRAEVQWEKINRPLVYFVDYQMRSSALPFAFDWPDMAPELGYGLSGDEEFFRNHVDADLRKDSATAIERLQFYHECMGLGFAGMYALEPKVIEEKMRQLRTRIAGKLGKNAFDVPISRLTPDAYAPTDETHLAPEETNRVLTVIAVAGVGLCLLLLGLTFYVYISSTQHYLSDLETLQQQAGVAPEAPAEAGQTPTQ